MKQIIYIIAIIFLVISFFVPRAIAQDSTPTKELEVYFFYSQTCPHCAAEKEFLDNIAQDYPEIKIYRFSIDNSENHSLLKDLAKKHDVERYIGLVPMTFVGEDFFLGFDNPKNIGKKIEDSINRQIQDSPEPSSDSKINIPIIGELDIDQYSLPVLAIVLGTLDGFNVCSLGALVLILGLILALRSRKKILIFGGIFILTTAVIYGLLISLWHKLFSFLAPYQKLMVLLIALLGIGGGIYFLKEFIRFKKRGPTCATTESPILGKFSKKIQNGLKSPGNIFALLSSVLLFAAVITIVEFPCSAAIPVVFAGILAKSQLPITLYLTYISIFVIFYMLDEIVIFLVALFTLKIWLASPKFVTWITLIEAITLFALGLYYLIGA